MNGLNLETSNVKNVVKAGLTSKAIEPAAMQNPDGAQDSNVVDLLKPISFSRTLEAYSDCV